MSDLRRNFPQTAAAIEKGIERALHRGVQISVSLNGEVVADGAVGTSHDVVDLTSDTLMPWLSAGKPLTAVCVMRLVEQGELRLDEPVASLLPEFADPERTVTLRHLLTHTAGLRVVPVDLQEASWEQTVEAICQAGVEEGWEVGRQARYEPQRSWILLGEIVARLEGRPVAEVVRDEILLPLGMRHSWIAIPARQWVHYGDRIGVTYVVRGNVQEPTDLQTKERCRVVNPGSSFRGPIRELRKFYEMLLAEGRSKEGEQILQPQTVALMTRRHREGLYDETFGHVLDFGLGLIINSRRYGPDTVPYGFGERASEEAFGHGGARSAIAFADPARGLVVCVVANGYPSEPQHQRRMRRILAALESDLEQQSA
jgi:CubicO group peptidase (beta-lactamase class C family)